MEDVFRQIEGEEQFKKLVRDHHTTFVSEIGILKAKVAIDEDRLGVAFEKYTANVSTFKVLIDSSEPDHFKRAGALLEALYSSQVITVFEPSSETEDKMCGLYLGYSHDDVQHDMPLWNFYDQYHNQAAAFDLAFRCCDHYEVEPHGYEQEYAETICNYLKSNSSLALETMFLLFKSLMYCTTNKRN